MNIDDEKITNRSTVIANIITIFGGGALLISIIGYLGSLLFRIWQGDKNLSLKALILTGVLCIVLSWFAYSQKTKGRNRHENRYPKYYKLARKVLAFILIVAIPVGVFLAWRLDTLDKKTIIVFAEIDGPEEVYRMNSIIIPEIRKQISDFPEIQLVVENPISELSKEGTARNIGNKYQADLVIWGWYTGTSTEARINLHIESLNPAISLMTNLDEANPGSPLVRPVDQLDNFTLQPEVSTDLTSLTLFVSGLSYYYSNNCDAASQRFQQALTDKAWESTSVGIEALYFYQANCLMKQGKYEDALDNYTIAIEKNNEFVSPYINRGVARLNTLDLIGAIADSNTVLENNKWKSRNDDLAKQYKLIAYTTRCIANARLNHNLEAVNDCNEALSIQESFVTYLNLGSVYPLDKSDLSFQALDKALELANDNQKYNVYYTRGVIYGELGNLNEAIENYTLAINFRPDYAMAWNNRGNNYLDTGDQFRDAGDFSNAAGEYEKARLDFEMAIKIDPEFDFPYNNLGTYYIRLENFSDALINFSKAIEVNPSYAIAHVGLGSTYMKISMSKRLDPSYIHMAILEFNRALIIEPNQSDAICNKGIGLYFLEQYDEAFNNLEKCTEISNDPYLVSQAKDFIEAGPGGMVPIFVAP